MVQGKSRQVQVKEREQSSRRAGEVDVSVLVITYNHERYIGVALRSVLAQRSTRRVEIIVSEDRSTDGAYEIVRACAEAHPAIKIIRSETNLASNAVISRAIAAASGKYICLLDGDDFWIDDNKIERQADVLDNDPSLAAVFHNAVVVDTDGAKTADRWTSKDQPRLIDAAELWQGNPFATCAGMLRREALAGLGAWYDDFFPITDWPLYLLCAGAGKIAFFDDPVGAYRLHETGLFSSLAATRKLDQVAGFYKRMRRLSSPAQRTFARAGETRYFFEWAVAHERNGERRLALNCLRRALLAGGVGPDVSVVRFVRVGWRLLWRRPGARAA